MTPLWLKHPLAWRRQPTLWLVVLLVALATYRFSLVGSGHFYWGDEWRYRAAEKLVDDFQVGEHRAGVAHGFEVTFRPGFVLVSVLPALAQRIVGDMLSIPRGTLRYYDAASAFNVLITLGIAGCVFALARRWTQSGWYALLVTAVHALLASSNVWIRHLVPYNEALLIFLAALLLLTSVSRTTRKPWWKFAAAGALSALGYTCYPGYYAFVLINAVVLVVASGRSVYETHVGGTVQRSRRRRRSWAVAEAEGAHGPGTFLGEGSGTVPPSLNTCRWRVASMGLFGAAAAAVLGGFELLARWAGTSYIQSLLEAPRLHAQELRSGLCEEGYIFAWRYLRDVEGPIGVALLLSFAGFAGLVLWRRRAPVPSVVRAAVLAALACYLVHATQSAVRHRAVFYGRLLLMYLPLVVCVAGLAIMHLRRAKLRAMAVCGLLVLSGWSFMSFAGWYHQVQYPGDFFFKTLAARGASVAYPPDVLWSSFGAHLEPTDDGSPPLVALVAEPYPQGFGVHLPAHEVARTCGARFLGVNLKWMRDIPETHDTFEPPAGYRLVAQALNPFDHPAIAYEERTRQERKRLTERKYLMRFYEREVEMEN